MGNCFASNKIVSQNDPQNCSNEANEAIKETRNFTVSNKERPAGVNMKKKKKKKVVRFKINEEDGGVDDRSGEQGESNNGVVRIRLVVTRGELEQMILSAGKDLKQLPSMERLIKVLKLRGVRVSAQGRRASDDDEDGGFHGGWMLALESIQEEH